MTGEHACADTSIPVVSGSVWAWIQPRTDWCTDGDAKTSHCPGVWDAMSIMAGATEPIGTAWSPQHDLIVFTDRTADPWRWSCADGFGAADLPKVTTISWGWP